MTKKLTDEQKAANKAARASRTTATTKAAVDEAIAESKAFINEAPAVLRDVLDMRKALRAPKTDATKKKASAVITSPIAQRAKKANDKAAAKQTASAEPVQTPAAAPEQPKPEQQQPEKIAFKVRSHVIDVLQLDDPDGMFAGEQAKSGLYYRALGSTKRAGFEITASVAVAHELEAVMQKIVTNVRSERRALRAALRRLRAALTGEPLSKRVPRTPGEPRARRAAATPRPSDIRSIAF